jgi:lipopolysaccharide transport system ATP-binding protein
MDQRLECAAPTAAFADLKMANDVVIRAEGLGKKFLIGHMDDLGWHFTFRDRLVRSSHHLWRKATDMVRSRPASDTVEEFWALKDVSFQIKQGEVVGIIGRNGAGKSTLLKILSRITEPSKGRVTIHGRVASLLEVGTGFHVELTGRENIYLNGAILGMTRREITQKFDEIVAFAEVEKFLDTPVKRYSSGMYVRLAFAVAAHLEPEILIVDEVLAVGDAEFQKKCLGKMDDVSRHEGRTVLLVSHNMGVIARLCGPAIWLDQGSILDYGPAAELTTKYLSRSRISTDRVVRVAELLRPDQQAANRLRIEELEWISPWPLFQGGRTRARITFSTKAPISDLSVGIAFRNVEGSLLMECCSDLSDGARKDLPGAGRYAATIEIDSLPLAPDAYTLDIGCRSGDAHALDYIPGCAEVDVIPGSRTLPHTIGKCAGVQLPTAWSWEEVRESV